MIAEKPNWESPEQNKTALIKVIADESDLIYITNRMNEIFNIRHVSLMRVNDNRRTDADGDKFHFIKIEVDWQR